MLKMYKVESYEVFSRSKSSNSWISDGVYDNLADAEKEAERVSRNNYQSKVVDLTTKKVIARYKDMMKKESRSTKRESFRDYDPLNKNWVSVNTRSEGGVRKYGVKLWSGAGYSVSLYSVWADDPSDAISRVASYCKEHEPGMVVSVDVVYSDLRYDMCRKIEENPSRYGFTPEEMDSLSDEEICSRLEQKNNTLYWELWNDVWTNNGYDELYFETDDPYTFVRAENMWVDEWPDDLDDLDELYDDDNDLDELYDDDDDYYDD